jgi:hypothetical protein
MLLPSLLLRILFVPLLGKCTFYIVLFWLTQVILGKGCSNFDLEDLI